jgi:hypothetical protein
VSARRTLALALAGALAAVMTAAATAAAQPASTQARTILVAEGGSYDVLLHPDFVTVVYLPDAIQKAIASDPAGYEVKPIGATSLAIRPLLSGSARDARPASLAIVTATVKISIVLRIAASRDEAMTQVTFKRAEVEAELRRRIDDGVRERTAALESRLAEMQRTMDAALPALAEELIAARVLQRRDRRPLRAIERNDDHVVVEATEVVYLGDDAYVLFAIENRGRAPFRVARVELRDRARDRLAVVRIAGDAAEAPGPGVLGVVRPGGNGRGVIVVRRAADVTGTPLALTVSGPGGRGRITLDRIVLP